MNQTSPHPTDRPLPSATTLAVVLLALLAFLPFASAAAQQISLTTLLREMVDPEALTRSPSPSYRALQFSSYDPASTSPQDRKGWFANADAGHFLRSEQVPERSGGTRTEHVMAEATGPGAIVRIWSANPAGTLRMYVDGELEIEMPMERALAGELIADPLSGERSRGYNLHLPIPFAKSIKVTSDADAFYYHVQVRLYDQDARVSPFRMKDLQEAASEVEEVRRALQHPRQAEGQTTSVESAIPGGSGGALLTLPDGPAAVRELRVTAPADALALRSLVLVLEFDGHQTVWCPLSDFFGIGLYGLGAPEDVVRDGQWAHLSRGFFMDARSNQSPAVERPVVELTCRFAMPYAQTATLRLLNLARHEAPTSIQAVTTPYRWDQRSMYFATTWRQERDIQTRPMQDFRYVSVLGRGVLVGDALAIANPVEEWWGEGDEKIYVDAETFPSHFGTGTEDYYGYAWCSNEPFMSAFHAQPRCDGKHQGGNLGHTTVARWRSLDAIPFNTSLDFDMEVWHWADCAVTYAATTWLYISPGASVRVAPSPDEVRAGLPRLPPPPVPYFVEGALECETMEVIGVTPGVAHVNQDLRGFQRGAWSGERHLWIQARNDADAITLRVPCERAGPVRVKLHATESWDYATVQVRVNDKVAVDSLDLSSATQGVARPSKMIDLGVHEAVPALAGEARADAAPAELFLTVEVIGTSTSGRFFGLDCVVLEPVAR